MKRCYVAVGLSSLSIKARKLKAAGRYRDQDGLIPFFLIMHKDFVQFTSTASFFYRKVRVLPNQLPINVTYQISSNPFAP
jgi:hypothetical protein